MEAIVDFKKRVDSLIERSYEGNVSLLGFLDEAMQGVLLEEMKYHTMVVASSDGGIINADRKRFIIHPDGYDNLKFKIAIYEIVYNGKFYEISHRQILGSLMSLGIKRECIGDIIIDDSGAYMAITEEIAPFIEGELHFIGRCPIELKRTDKMIINEPKYEDKTHFLASLRLDVVIASAYNLSRKEALEIIKDGLVFINQINILNPTQIAKENDIISVRHKGKLKISSIGGTTKSGRIMVVISKRI